MACLAWEETKFTVGKKESKTGRVFGKREASAGASEGARRAP